MDIIINIQPVNVPAAYNQVRRHFLFLQFFNASQQHTFTVRA